MRRAYLYGGLAVATVLALVIALAATLPRLHDTANGLDLTDFHLSPGPRNDTARLHVRLQWRRCVGDPLKNATGAISTRRGQLLVFDFAHLAQNASEDKTVRIDTLANITDPISYYKLAQSRQRREPLRLTANTSTPDRTGPTYEARFTIDPRADISR